MAQPDFCLIRRADNTIAAGPMSAHRLVGYRISGVQNLSTAQVKAVVAAVTDGDLALYYAWPADDEPALAKWQNRTGRTYSVDVPSQKVSVSVTDVDRNLAQMRAERKQAVNAEAERRRLLYITPGEGKVLEYREKVSELTRYDADQSPQAANYPIANAEASALGITLAQSIERIRTSYSQWKVIGASLAGTVAAKGKAIDDAADGAAIYAVDPLTGWSY